MGGSEPLPERHYLIACTSRRLASCPLRRLTYPRAQRGRTDMKDQKLELTKVGIYECLCIRRPPCFRRCPEHMQKLRHFTFVPEVELLQKGKL